MNPKRAVWNVSHGRDEKSAAHAGLCGALDSESRPCVMEDGDETDGTAQANGLGHSEGVIMD